MNKLHGFLAQRISPWNGALYTRGALLERLKQNGWSDQAIDFWVFHPDALSSQQIEELFASGHLINKVPNVFPHWYEEFEEECEDELVDVVATQEGLS